jgi:hypothetical protein
MIDVGAMISLTVVMSPEEPSVTICHLTNHDNVGALHLLVRTLLDGLRIGYPQLVVAATHIWLSVGMAI